SSITVTTLNYNDIDNDPEGYLYQWYVNDNPVSGAESKTLDPVNFKAGDEVYVEVTPFDGEHSGEPRKSSDAAIANSPPPLHSVEIGAGPYNTNDTITVTVDASDADGDPLTYEYSWEVNGGVKKSETVASNTSQLDGSNFVKGETVRVL